MGNKSAAYWEVRSYRRGEYSVLSKSRTADVGRAAFWAAVDQQHTEMLREDSMVLLNGAREIITVRVVGNALAIYRGDKPTDAS